MRIMCLMLSTWKVVDWTKWRSTIEMIQLQYLCSGVFLLGCHAVFHLPHSWVSEQVNHSGADVQVVPCHCYPVVFHPIVQQLPVLYISGLVLWTRSLACHWSSIL